MLNAKCSKDSISASNQNRLIVYLFIVFLNVMSIALLLSKYLTKTEGIQISCISFQSTLYFIYNNLIFSSSKTDEKVELIGRIIGILEEVKIISNWKTEYYLICLQGLFYNSQSFWSIFQQKIHYHGGYFSISLFWFYFRFLDNQGILSF